MQGRVQLRTVGAAEAAAVRRLAASRSEPAGVVQRAWVIRARLDDPALSEPVDDAVAGEPADRHGHLERDEPQPGGGGASGQLGAQVERAPRRRDVLGDRAEQRQQAEQAERPQHRGAGADPAPGGRLGVGVVLRSG